MNTAPKYSMTPTFVSLLDQLQQTAADFADKEFDGELDELRRKVNGQKLNLVVVGLFKRGKSSLVNALLGKDLAPVAVTPLTTVVSTFEHDPGRSYARILFQGGSFVDIPQTATGPYVSEEQNPANHKKVEMVRIFDNTLPLLKMLTLIDTPGIGSAFAYNTETTRQFIPRIDAALFVLSADLPVTQADIDFLRELKPSVRRILFLLNKKELLDAADLQKLIAHNARILRDQGLLGPEDSLLPVSVRLWQAGQGPASGIDKALDVIRQMMEEGGDQLLSEVFQRRYGWLRARLLLQLRLKEQSLLLPTEELEMKQLRLREVQILLKDQKREFEHSIRGETQLLQQSIQRTLQQEADAVRNEFRRQTGQQIARLLDEKALQAYQAEWNSRMRERFEGHRQRLEEEVRRKFNQVLGEYSQRTASFLNELITQLSSLMGIDFELIAGTFDLDVYTAFYLAPQVAPPVTLSHSLFSGLLPAKSRERRLLGKLCLQFDALVVQYSAAVIYDLQYRIQESFRKFSHALERRLYDLVDNMDRLLAETLLTQKEHRDRIGEQLNDVRRRIETAQQENFLPV